MANTALKKITSEAKKIRKRKPKTSWKSAVKQAGAKYRSGKLKPRKKTAKKKAVKRKVVKRKVATRKKSAPRKKAVRRKTTRRRKVASVGAVGAVRKRRRRTATKKVTRRRVGSKKGSGLKTALLVAGVGLAAYLLINKSSSPKVVYVPTGNVNRDSQAQSIINYVAAAGASAAQIASLLNALNTKTDADVDYAYKLTQQGTVPNYLLA